MCKNPTPKNQNYRTRLLLSKQSFYCVDEKGEKGPLPPSLSSTLLSTSFLILLQFAVEHLTRLFFYHFIMDTHPIFADESNRMVLSRQLGTNVFMCTLVAILGLRSKHIMSGILSSITGKTSVDLESFEKRLYTYHPEAQQLLLFFFAYQIKNLYDSYVWNDGIEFLLHHVVSGIAAWGGMYPGICGSYAIFYMGISEVSTAVLSFLANFDDKLGVPGLDRAFPITRLATAFCFVILFIICRIILWPYVTYYFYNDCQRALKRNSPKETVAVRFTIKTMLICCLGLSVLQVIWLGQIFYLGYTEISALLADSS
mmetsp:Transcript_2048/g.2907  ORF Transcript_2048/g.2907 Transcript_2048/m.2907 type:complete len:313 (+) Transcript_2048:80-1018(+)